MQFDAVRFASLSPANQRVPSQFATRRLVELFIPGLSERATDDLIPEPWTASKPVRLVTARTILLAGMTSFFRDHRDAIVLIQGASACANCRALYPLLTGMHGAIRGA
jgi:hypothetical protein